MVTWSDAARLGVRRRFAPTLGAGLALSFALAGCSQAPSQNILGSYFPSWMLCALAGIGLTVVARQLLGAVGLDRALPVPLLVYLALATAFAFATWLLWLD